MTRSGDESRVSYHEAGHAVAARLLDIEVAIATVVASDGALGHVKHTGLADYARLAEDPDGAATQIRFEHAAMVYLAGCMAERRHIGALEDDVRGYEGALEDLNGASALIELLAAGDEELLKIWLQLLDARVDRLLHRNWWAVEKVAMALLERRTLSGAQVDELIRSSAGK